MKAIVIGAGIGGLSAAVALKNAGIDCTVFEAVKEIKPVGAAISIWPNGVKCMQHLGMGDMMEIYGGPMRFMAYKDHRRGDTLTRFSLTPLVERTGGRPCPVSRAELQREMLNFWGRDAVQFAKRVEHVVEDDAGVTVTFTDGSTATGDFLIAADGSHSAVRPYVLGYTPERRYAGYVNWNGLVKIDEEIAPAHQWTTFVGEGKRVSLMPVSGGRFYFFLMSRSLSVWRRIATPCVPISLATSAAGQPRCRNLSKHLIQKPLTASKFTISIPSTAWFAARWHSWEMPDTAPRRISARRLCSAGRCRGTGGLRAWNPQH
jgi:2-polyprenyl-6-methoxyphenol hydroxylase-like FAD-dependent oxidoreductase